MTAPPPRIGTSGWNYQHWRGIFYPRALPPARWLAYYADQFDTVEINYSFYRLPSRESFAAWAAQAPDSFLFAVKGNRFITHLKRLVDIVGPSFCAEIFSPSKMQSNSLEVNIKPKGRSIASRC